MLYALGRDGMLPRGLARVSPGSAVPATALAVSMLLSLGLLVGFAAAGATALHTFFYLATIGVLSLLLMYVVTNLGAARLLGLRGSFLPACGIAVATYTLYRNVWPVPEHPFDLFPYVVLAWLGLGALLTLAVPGFAPRVRAALAQQQVDE
jgi:amino acid transporter